MLQDGRAMSFSGAIPLLRSESCCKCLRYGSLACRCRLEADGLRRWTPPCHRLSRLSRIGSFLFGLASTVRILISGTKGLRGRSLGRKTFGAAFPEIASASDSGSSRHQGARAWTGFAVLDMVRRYVRPYRMPVPIATDSDVSAGCPRWIPWKPSLWRTFRSRQYASGGFYWNPHL